MLQLFDRAAMRGSPRAIRAAFRRRGTCFCAFCLNCFRYLAKFFPLWPRSSLVLLKRIAEIGDAHVVRTLLPVPICA
jgi:hypothetical protein